MSRRRAKLLQWLCHESNKVETCFAVYLRVGGLREYGVMECEVGPGQGVLRFAQSCCYLVQASWASHAQDPVTDRQTRTLRPYKYLRRVHPTHLPRISSRPVSFPTSQFICLSPAAAALEARPLIRRSPRSALPSALSGNQDAYVMPGLPYYRCLGVFPPELHAHSRAHSGI